MPTRWLPRELTVDHKQKRLGIGQLDFKVLQHSACSSHLAPSDYHFFGSLKVALRDRRFFSKEAEREAVHKWLHDKAKNFLRR